MRGKQKQLQPLTVQLSRVKDLTPPDFGTLAQWEKRAIAAGRMSSNGEAIVDLPKASHGQGLTGTPMPFLGETKVHSDLCSTSLVFTSSTKSYSWAVCTSSGWSLLLEGNLIHKHHILVANILSWHIACLDHLMCRAQKRELCLCRWKLHWLGVM